MKTNVAMATVLWTTLTAANSGGGMYIDHPGMSVSMEVPLTVTSSTATSGTGGFFNILKAVNVAISSSTFMSLSSLGSGSFLYSTATTLVLTVTGVTGSSTVDCSNQGNVAAWTSLSSSLALATPVASKGGAFYISGATTPTVVTDLTVRNCYTGDSGGAFSMINADLIDTGSTYEYNGAIQGGVVYCSGCALTLESITYNHNEAHQGGTFYLNNPKATSGFTQSSITLLNSKAYENGGAFYVTGTTTQTLDISQMTVTSTTAVNFGGMMYVDNSNQGILAGDLSLTTSAAGVSGGGFYFANVATVTINQGSEFSTLSAPTHGSFMCSVATTLVLSMTDATVQCKTDDITYTSHL